MYVPTVCTKPDRLHGRKSRYILSAPCADLVYVPTYVLMYIHTYIGVRMYACTYVRTPPFVLLGGNMNSHSTEMWS